MAQPQTQREGAPIREDLTGTSVGRFAIRTRLGGGGMGEVYLAEDTALKRPVALKRLAPRLRTDAQFRHRFLREAERASALSHQNIAGIHDVLDEHGEMFLVMEYVEGETLRKRMRGGMPVREFLPIALQCAEALAAAHEAGVVHCDIKPENIMLRPSGQVKILDFGVAKRTVAEGKTAAAQTVSVTAPHGLSGTPGYMAPEVLREQTSDARCDLFSLGVVFYEMLAGRPPFRAETFVETAQRILYDHPPALTDARPELPGELNRIVHKLLAKEPEERYATARDLLADLRALRRMLATGAALPVPAARRLPRKMKLLAAASLVVLVALPLAVPSVRQRAARWLFPVAIPAEPRVAILVTTNGEASPETEGITRGIRQTLGIHLAESNARLQVVPPVITTRGVSGRWEERPVDSAAAARSAGANLLLPITVALTDDTVQVRYTLTDLAGAVELGGDVLEVPRDELPALEQHLVRSVLGKLELATLRNRPDGVPRRIPAVQRAYEPYVQARGYLENYPQRDKVERAIGAFQRAIELDENFAPAYAGLGVAHWRMYEHTRDPAEVERGRAACRRAAELDARLADAHVCLGTIANATGQYEQAIGEFEFALHLDRQNQAAYRGLGSAYEALGRTEDAEKTFRGAVDVRPNDWISLNSLGAFYYRLGRFQEAVAAFERAIEAAPENVLLYTNLGGTFHVMGRLAEAQQMYERSLELEPNYRAYSNLGTLHFGKQRYGEAARMYEEALELRASDYRVWYNLASAYHWMDGKEDQAAAAYRRAAELAEKDRQVNARDPGLLVKLADCYAMTGEAERARVLLRQTVQFGSNDAELLLRVGEVYENLGEREAALEWIGKALAQGLPTERVETAPGLKRLQDDPRFQQLLRNPPGGP